ncbi:hypothetical protein [Pedobacter sp. UYP1]|uniref:sacsin N-terminal ATP-binding-like domain-containing protein n=1 Tax=Pedobacter sp. UYP1 TaxID=1756396 RepID=UPI003398B0B1
MIKSLEEGRKEDGNRSIADKVLKRLHDLQKTVENNYGRWAWELLQNAKDSIADYADRKVSIQLELWDDKVQFRHNGMHFTESDVRGIINQISSKESEEDQPKKKVGRFGTGFLTTHLLSKVVDIEGVVETVDGEFYSFDFSLDRTGATIAELVPKIEDAWNKFQTSVELLDNGYNLDTYNTSFTYKLASNSQKEIAKVGVDEFISLIPYVLAFIPVIDEVEIKDNTTESFVLFKNNSNNVDDLLVPIEKTVGGKKTIVWIMLESSLKVSIAGELVEVEGRYNAKSLKGLPKIFCEFPMIGTEDFHFPVLVNSFHFNPLTERDGIWLKNNKEESDVEVLDNQALLKEAVELYRRMIAKIENKNYFKLHNLATAKIPDVSDKFFDENWYKKNIQAPIREIISAAAIVDMELQSAGKKKPQDVYFPVKSYAKGEYQLLWQACYDLVPTSVCRVDDMEEWVEQSFGDWKEISYQVILSTIAARVNIPGLSKVLGKNEKETFAWYNSVCEFIFKNDTNLPLYTNNIFIPNQHGVFKRKSELFLDGIHDDTLVEILRLLGEDWKNILLSKDVQFGEYPEKHPQDIATEIAKKLKPPFEYTEQIRQGITALAELFETDSEQGKELFPDLFRRRAETFMNVIEDKESLYKIMRSKVTLAQLSEISEKIEEHPNFVTDLTELTNLSKLLAEFRVHNVLELKEMLLAQKGGPSQLKIEIDADILLSLGVSTKDELDEALKDKDLAALFSHSSTPNADLYIYVQTLISRAKLNVISHLKTLNEYVFDELDELAPTVYGGIVKKGIDITIVVRPSDNGQVIVYYPSENDYLDFENAELWIDDGKTVPRHLTLGRILKTTGIRKIPV